MEEDAFKAPQNRKAAVRNDGVYGGAINYKRPRTKEDFIEFCRLVLQYTQYESEHPERMVLSNGSPDRGDDSNTDSIESSDSIGSVGGRRPPEDQEDVQKVTCFCGKPFGNRPMIECSECLKWIHLSCAKIRRANIPDYFVCQHCKESKQIARKSSRVRTESKRLKTSS